MGNRRAVSVLRTTVLGLAVLCGMAEATEVPLLSPQEAAGPGRFQVLEAFHGEAVLDRTTQLIWERTPSQTEVAWETAGSRCALKSVGGQAGWRLPSFFELMTLVEPAPRGASAAPTLPTGHPFQGVKARAYWATSSLATGSTEAYAVDFLRGDVTSRHKYQAQPLWCVRGGTPASPARDTAPSRHDII